MTNSTPNSGFKVGKLKGINGIDPNHKASKFQSSHKNLYSTNLNKQKTNLKVIPSK